jgi:hypothetical protein
MITLEQYEELVDQIYKLLMANPEMGMGEMGECREAATLLVDAWTVHSKVQVEDTSKPFSWSE